ncbi:MAG: methionyl-tRNA formyltransferase [Dehalococcoidales bacterium]|nr:methionyl-tRNA formyltransferase [Dehalococcoidales bacterium]
MRIVFMGTPEFAVPCLEHLILNQYQVVAVYTQPDKPAGRGRSLVSPPLKRAALTWKLPVVQPVSLKGAEAVAQLAGFHPDVIVVAAFGQILPPSVLDIPAYGCINIHPSLLPRFRGASPVAAAILAGDEFTGVSIMLMDKGLDTGPILAKAQIPISPQDTTGSLTAKLSQIAARLLQEVLVRWLRGEIAPQPQNEAEATYCSSISKEEGEIDWHLPAIDIWRRVRAFHPWPGCYTRWLGRQLKIIEAVPLPEETAAEVGRVVALTPTAEGKKAVFGVYTGDGILGVLRVQLEGKQAMSAAEFLRGQRQFIGAALL